MKNEPTDQANAMRALILLAFCLLLPDVQAHGGRTNSQGCHNDNVRGGYHCHNGGRAPQAAHSAPETSAPKVPAPETSAPARTIPRTTLNTRLRTDNPAARTVTQSVRTCEQIKDAGKAPIAHWEPEYHKDLDPNGNGWGCESFEMDARVGH